MVYILGQDVMVSESELHLLLCLQCVADSSVWARER